MTKGTVTPAQLDKILDQLSSDHHFRERMLGDPAGVLAEHGIQIDPSEVPAVRHLPSTEMLARQRESIKGKIQDRVCLIFFVQTT